MPSADECRQLCEVVWREYPKLRPGRGEEEEFFGQFRAAFQFVQHHGRRAEVDRERSLGWWLDTAREFISQHRISAAFRSAGWLLLLRPSQPATFRFLIPANLALWWGSGGAAVAMLRATGGSVCSVERC
jgi:hypothetical protein